MTFYNSDCFDIFPKLEDNSVDLFILDLPYSNKKFGNCTACNWDTPINLKEMWIQIKRIMKPNAVIVHFCNTKFGFSLIESNPKMFKYDLIWKKSKKVGFLSCNKMPLRQHENIYIFKDKQGTYNPQKTEGKPYKCIEGNKKKDDVYNINNDKKAVTINKGDRHPTSIIDIELEPDHENIYIFKEKQGTYNPQKTKGKPYKSKGREEGKGVYIKDSYYRTPTEDTENRHPTSIIENTILSYNNPHKNIHPTQKPVDLIEWLIKTYSNEEDTVMDFCAGSGTVGIGCINLNRKYILVEKDEEIYNVAKKRIDEHLKSKDNK